MAELVRLLTNNTNPSVIVTVMLLLVIVTVFGGIVTWWIKPKLTEFDTLKTELWQLKPLATQENVNRLIALSSDFQGLKDAKPVEKIQEITSRLIALESTKGAEQRELEMRLEKIQDTVKQALADVQLLQERSKEEIVRIQTESLNKFGQLDQKTREELGQLNQRTREDISALFAAQSQRVSVEQAEQDVMLAAIAEHLARLTPGPEHQAAQNRLAEAKVRLQMLRG